MNMGIYHTWPVDRINIIIVPFVSLIASLFIIVSPSSYTVLLIALFLASVIFLFNPKAVVYFLIVVFPLIPTIAPYATLNMGSTYFSINMGGILNIGITLLALSFLFVRKTPVFKYRMTVPIIFFLSVLLISILFSPLKVMSLRWWFRYAMPAAIYFVILESVGEPDNIKRLLKFTLFSSIPILFIGFWQLRYSNGLYVVSGLGFNRVYSTLGHPSTYAMFLIVLLLLTIFLIFQPGSKHKWIYLTLFIGMVILLIGTYTRVGWVAFLVAISIAGFLRYRKFYFLFLTVGLVVMLYLPHLRSDIVLRLQPDTSFWGRFVLNRIGWSLFTQSPLLGQGVGSYELLSQSFIGTVREKYGIKVGLAPHNDYVRFLVEGGVLALTAFLFLIYRALKLSIGVFRSADPAVRDYGLFLLSLIVAMLVFGITDQGFEYAGFYFWLFLAIGEVYFRRCIGY